MMKTITTKLATGAILAAIALPASADQVILDDLIVDGSICVGMDCVNGESFGFDTLRLKENNLRIRAVDTSSTSSFPTNDWQITFNDSANGGANKFSIDDIDGGRTPFTIEAGAPSHSLYVSRFGRLGLGTSTPSVELHVKDGDTPTLRLEQDGSAGFTPQTWDVAGNETNFFIRDATNGSTLPFRIFPGAPHDALTIQASTGNIGLGTTSPAEKLHIMDGALKIESAAGTAAVINLGTATSTWVIKQTGTGRMTISSPGGGATTAPFKFDRQATENLFRVGILGASTVDINGELIITGNCTEQDGACADYVFEPDYELRSLDELDAFIAENRHLPNVPSADEMNQHGVSMTHLSGRLLEKIEELVLYTLEQQNTIDQQDNSIKKLEARIEKIESDG